MSRLFSVTEKVLCKIAGVPFESYSIDQQNAIMFATALLKNRRNYYDGMEETLANILEPVGLEVSGFENAAAGRYCTISNPNPVFHLPTNAQMVEFLSGKLGLDEDLISSWSDDNIQLAYDNLNAKKQNDETSVGYFIVDNYNTVGFRVSSDEEDIDELIARMAS